ncbi:c-type cytochrome [Corallococcus macrosporus]|uniref:Cytochrome c n=1 Tax=Corallococcus macrosporus DSM 14697 TaxID=1189310 RepID=A0A250JR09_9BACT|nr:c-type cytochrome [Corallococcus macrosporus]ATB46098.1 cytochrome c [Corallococcus macrosporus DSM 14697]
MRRPPLDALRNTLLAGATLLAGCAGTVHAPYPPIRADLSPAALERGAAIFHASCESCHRGGDAETASGAPLRELPSYMGRFYAANLTAHAEAGIGGMTDEELARAIRYAVSRDGRLMVMPSYGMGDADLAAVLGFMRSGHPLFTPDPEPAPPSKFSFFGGIGFRFITGNEPVERPASGIPVPPKAATLEYGHYMAHDVYDCASCHTDGFSPRKTEGDDVFAGGMAFVDPEGRKVHSSNITFHETGLAHWTLEDFTRAVRDGLAPDGSVLRSPMPRFRGMDAVEAQALYDYLRSVPHRKNAVEGARPRLTATSARPDWVAETHGAQTPLDGAHAQGRPAAAPASGAAHAKASEKDAGGSQAPQASSDAKASEQDAGGSQAPQASSDAPAQGSDDTTRQAPSQAGPGTTPATSPAGPGVGTPPTPAPRAAADTSASPEGSNASTPSTSATRGDAAPGSSKPASKPAPRRKPRPAVPQVDAAGLFVKLGCASCHAPGARYHDRLAKVATRSEAELVRWVRNPEQFLPGTPMPTYAELIDEKTARALVRWVKAGGPASLTSTSR